MSNVMSRSKSRWKKGALLATVAAVSAAPLAAKAATTIDLSLQPLGSTVPYSLQYLTADTNTVTIYVYATVTGTGTPGTATSGAAAPSTSGNFDGLQYAYYNINNSTGNPIQNKTGGVGAFTTGALNATLGFNATGSDISSNTSGGGGAQVGTFQNILNGVSVGSVAGTLSDYAKPRAAQPVWSNATSYNSSTGYTSLNDGTNIVTAPNSGVALTNTHSAAFLLETLTYTTPWAGNPGAFNASSLTSVQSMVFNSVVPTLPVNYAPANIFTDSPSSAPASPASLASVTSSNYSAGAGVTLTSTIKGDANADGIVNIVDFNILTSNFNKTGNFSQGNFEEGSSGTVNIVDFNDLTANFNKSIGPNPAAADAPLYAFAVAHNDLAGYLAAGGLVPVPEPTSIGLIVLSGSALLARRSRRRIG